MAMSIDAAGIALALGGAKRSGNGWAARCPVHDDNHASLVIYDQPNGGVNVKCMADCEQGAVIARLQAMRLWPQSRARKDPSSAQAAKDRRRRGEITEVLDRVPDNMPEPDWNSLSLGPPTSAFEYRGVDGGLLGYVLRWDSLTDSKRILPLSPARLRDGSAEWVMKAPAKFTLYGLEQLAQRPDADVYLVEGEKAADAGRRLLPDAIVLSWRGGAGAVNKTDFGPLQDRNVTIIPDADDAGKRAALSVEARATAAGTSTTRIIDVPQEFPKGWDVADSFPKGWSLEALLGRTLSDSTAEGTQEARENALASYVILAADLVKMDIPPREYIIHPWMTTQSLNMLYSQRGLGKTWVGLTIGISVASGEDFLGFEVEHARPVLYIDGEMPLPDLQARLVALAPSPPTNLMVLPSELLYRDDRSINLQDPQDRLRIDEMLATLSSEGRQPALIIIDNLSSMSGGIDENDNSALDEFLQWLVALRHAGAAVLMVHHAGKSGTQRGASRREDFLDTSIELKKPSEDRNDDEPDFVPHQGAHFILGFAKTRGMRPEPDELELKLTELNGQLIWTVGEVRSVDASVKILRKIWESSVETQKDLAAIVGRSAGRVSQLCSKLRRKNFIEPSPSIQLTIEGREELCRVFPEVEPRMRQQGHLFHRDVL